MEDHGCIHPFNTASHTNGPLHRLLLRGILPGRERRRPRDLQRRRRPPQAAPRRRDALAARCRDDVADPPRRAPGHRPAGPGRDARRRGLRRRLVREPDQASTFAALGKRVVCYFSAGSYEDGPTDSGDFDAGEGGDLGRELEGWPGEYWLDTNSETDDYMNKSVYWLVQTNRNGLGLTAADSIDCISFLAFEARRRGLAMGLKNGGSIIKNVLPVIDFSVKEECAAYSECDLYKAVTDAGKPCSTSSTRTWRKRGRKTRMRGDGPARRRARAGSAPS
ncbi:hypothetical protein BJF96_g976 [Verticillium dahliae]|uniref:alpha-galactosidase n=1 Tax=Verticillium dahliae TaxID=27337 RepID=A0AA45APX8_VERDA|nr:hypothetical protein BJF96_g976 [Verticillium dahliae]